MCVLNCFSFFLPAIFFVVSFKLLDMGADLQDSDPTGASALHHIARQYLQVYKPSRRGWSCHTHPEDYYKNCVELWKRYLDGGGSINGCDNTGSPPLFSY